MLYSSFQAQQFLMDPWRDLSQGVADCLHRILPDGPSQSTVAEVLMRHVPEGATQRLLLEKGDIDIARELTPTDIEGMAGNADVKVQQDVGGQVFYLSFNQKNEQYKNPKLLDAMRWAVDYEGMANSFLKGSMVVHQAYLPKGYLGALDDQPYKLDIEKAKALVAESGIENPKIVLDVRNATDRMEMAQSIQNTFGQAGINRRATRWIDDNEECHKRRYEQIQHYIAAGFVTLSVNTSSKSLPFQRRTTNVRLLSGRYCHSQFSD